jgi:outer membrane protein TolC
MHCISEKLIPWTLLTVFATAASPALLAQELDLAAAESLALVADPSVEAVRSRRLALNELEVAAWQLPDPVLRMGLMSLPTDTFHLGQEPMTQVAVGVVQKFPRGESRELRAEQFSERAAGLDEMARDQELRIILSVREEYLEALKQRHLAGVNREAEAAFSDLDEITRDYYASGRAQQQDVLQAAVELAKAHERTQGIGEEEDRARARLATWIGEDAWRPLADEWPSFAEPVSPEAMKEGLAEHPRLRALQQEVAAADTAVDIAEQAYKPEFSVDLAYGGRGGVNPDGSSRPDLFSVMVMMDLPFFTGNRQDRNVAAVVAESSAVTFARDDVYRRMRSEIDLHHRTLVRQRERLELFEESLLPEASFNAEAAFQAYQAGLEDMTTLIRARIGEFDLRIGHIRLQAEILKTLARLRYLEGGAS